MSASSSSTRIDYDALWRHTLATLSSLSYLKIPRYKIKTISGEVIVGGFGDVERVELRSLFAANRVMAQKRLRPSGDRNQRIRVMASLARELLVWSKLSHDNILKLEGFSFDETGMKTAWIVTLWMKNGNIKKYLEETNPDHTIRLKLALDTARGLAYLHELSPPVCHGDIKMENTLIDDSGNARLCDFGLSKVLEDVPTGLTTTQTGFTLRYAAPELISSGGRSRTLASDIWAWGCLFLGITTDTMPYPSETNDQAILRALMDNESPANTRSLDLPQVLKSLLDTCWKRTPAARSSVGYHAEEIAQYIRSPHPNEADLENTAVASPFLAAINRWQGSYSGNNVYFDITIGDAPAGRLVFILYYDVVPKTARNFRELSTGQNGFGYAGSPFHRIYPNVALYGGDFTHHDGTGGKAIYYGERFADENFVLKHTKPGLLSMANAGPDTNGSLFFITIAPIASFDGKHVVFGEVVEGFDLVKRIEQLETTSDGAPKKEVIIAASGIPTGRVGGPEGHVLHVFGCRLACLPLLSVWTPDDKDET